MLAGIFIVKQIRRLLCRIPGAGLVLAPVTALMPLTLVGAAAGAAAVYTIEEGDIHAVQKKLLPKAKRHLERAHRWGGSWACRRRGGAGQGWNGMEGLAAGPRRWPSRRWGGRAQPQCPPRPQDALAVPCSWHSADRHSRARMHACMDAWKQAAARTSHHIMPPPLKMRPSPAERSLPPCPTSKARFGTYRGRMMTQ
jgi:hypothetical protein